MKTLATLTLFSVLSPLLSQAATITNDGYPPIGGVTLAASGDPVGKGSGRTFSFSNFDFSSVNQMWWGLETNFPPKLSMNNNSGFTVGENLSFDAASSDLPAGIARFVGESALTYDFHNPPGITATIPVRLSLSLSSGSFFASTDLLASDPSFDTSQSVLTEVTGDFSVNLLAEAFFNSSWTPMLDLFDSQSTNPADNARTDFGTAFYSTAVPEPSTLALFSLAFTTLLIVRHK